MAQIRRDKLNHVLPDVMRENEVDMWITMIREANDKTLPPYTSVVPARRAC